MHKLYHHHVTVNDRYITINDGHRFVAGNVNADTLTAAFDSAWEECEIRVIFLPKSGKPIEQPYRDGMLVPWEVLTEHGSLYVTFVGVRDGNVVIETAMQSKPFVIDKEGVVDGADPVPPTPSEYQQLMAEISRIRQDIEAGLIKGDPGDDADIAGAEAAKNAANEAATRANAEADRAHDAALDAAAATQGADRAAREATNAADSADDAAQSAREADANATAAASNANAAATEIRQRADSGEFDGKPGEPFTYEDFTPEQLASLKGDDGAPGVSGVFVGTSDETPGDDANVWVVTDGEPDNIVRDTIINGSSIVVDGVANIPKSNDSRFGAVRFNTNLGITNGYEWVGNKNYDGMPYIIPATDSEISARQSWPMRSIRPSSIDLAVKTAMTDGRGPSWSESERLAARQRIGLGGDFELIEEITVENAVTFIDRNMTPDGREYNFHAAYFEIETQPDTETRNGYIRVNGLESGSDALSVPSMVGTASVKFSRTIAIPICGSLFCLSFSNSNAAGDTNSTNVYSTNLNMAKIPIRSLRFRVASNAKWTVGTKIRIYGAWV